MLAKIASQLATVASIADAKGIRDKADALARYHARQHCLDIERQAIIIRLKAERRLGELLRATVKRGSKSRPERHLPAGITDNLLTVKQATERLQVSQTVIRDACQAGTLRHARFGNGRGTIRIAVDDLEAFQQDAAPSRPRLRHLA